MSEYLLINILTIIFPLALSFESKIRFYKKAEIFSAAFLTTGLLYIVWDFLATKRGDWSFNDQFILGYKLFFLPIEEILFFVTIPYAALFLYETMKLYLKDNRISIEPIWFLYIGILLIGGGIVFNSQYYTSTVLIFSGLFLTIAYNILPELLRSSLYWKFITFSFIPFILVNYFLTSLPVVLYNPDSIWGPRFITIPLEDFFYSFSMLSLYLLVYIYSGERWRQKKSPLSGQD